jgi:hypothetical protein
MLAMCASEGNGELMGRECTCAVSVLDAGLSSNEKSLFIDVSVANSDHEPPAAREEARARLRTFGLDFERQPEANTPAGMFVEHVDQLMRDVRRTCPNG